MSGGCAVLMISHERILIYGRGWKLRSELGNTRPLKMKHARQFEIQVSGFRIRISGFGIHFQIQSIENKSAFVELSVKKGFSVYR